MKLFVIAPDAASGESFSQKLLDHGLSVALYFAYIEPRVIGTHINHDPKVDQDLSKAILYGFYKGFSHMAIACNTLQLWLAEAEKLLPHDVAALTTVYTTFEALTDKYRNILHRPLWLGTTVLTRALEPEYFDTLLTHRLVHMQLEVQEIIWRTKAVLGSDVSTASGEISDIKNPMILRLRMQHLVGELRAHKITSIILGCTELPIAFEKYIDQKLLIDFELIDPAEVLASYITKQVSAKEDTLESLVTP